jgi:hypothetical protein
MTATANPLPLPAGRPPDYVSLEDEPSFVAGEHFAAAADINRHDTLRELYRS